MDHSAQNAFDFSDLGGLLDRYYPGIRESVSSSRFQEDFGPFWSSLSSALDARLSMMALSGHRFSESQLGNYQSHLLKCDLAALLNACLEGTRGMDEGLDELRGILYTFCSSDSSDDVTVLSGEVRQLYGQWHDVSDLCSELTCQICFNMYVCPVSLPCKHNMCQACVSTQQSNGEDVTKTISKCPFCQAPFRKREINLDQQLESVVTHSQSVGWYLASLCKSEVKKTQQSRLLQYLQSAHDKDDDDIVRNIPINTEWKNTLLEQQETRTGSPPKARLNRKVVDKAVNEVMSRKDRKAQFMGEERKDVVFVPFGKEQTDFLDDSATADDNDKKDDNDDNRKDSNSIDNADNEDHLEQQLSSSKENILDNNNTIENTETGSEKCKSGTLYAVQLSVEDLEGTDCPLKSSTWQDIVIPSSTNTPLLSDLAGQDVATLQSTYLSHCHVCAGLCTSANLPEHAQATDLCGDQALRCVSCDQTVHAECYGSGGRLVPLSQYTTTTLVDSDVASFNTTHVWQCMYCFCADLEQFLECRRILFTAPVELPVESTRYSRLPHLRALQHANRGVTEMLAMPSLCALCPVNNLLCYKPVSNVCIDEEEEEDEDDDDDDEEEEDNEEQEERKQNNTHNPLSMKEYNYPQFASFISEHHLYDIPCHSAQLDLKHAVYNASNCSFPSINVIFNSNVDVSSLLPQKWTHLQCTTHHRELTQMGNLADCNIHNQDPLKYRLRCQYCHGSGERVQEQSPSAVQGGVCCVNGQDMLAIWTLTGQYPAGSPILIQYADRSVLLAPFDGAVIRCPLPVITKRAALPIMLGKKKQVIPKPEFVWPEILINEHTSTVLSNYDRAHRAMLGTLTFVQACLPAHKRPQLLHIVGPATSHHLPLHMCRIRCKLAPSLRGNRGKYIDYFIISSYLIDQVLELLRQHKAIFRNILASSRIYTALRTDSLSIPTQLLIPTHHVHSKKKHGYALQCVFGKCIAGFHVTCTFENGGKCELREDDVYGVHKLSFCHLHASKSHTVPNDVLVPPELKRLHQQQQRNPTKGGNSSNSSSNKRAQNDNDELQQLISSQRRLARTTNNTAHSSSTKQCTCATTDDALKGSNPSVVSSAVMWNLVQSGSTPLPVLMYDRSVAAPEFTQVATKLPYAPQQRLSSTGLVKAQKELIIEFCSQFSTSQAIHVGTTDSVAQEKYPVVVNVHEDILSMNVQITSGMSPHFAQQLRRRTCPLHAVPHVPETGTSSHNYDGFVFVCPPAYNLSPSLISPDLLPSQVSAAGHPVLQHVATSSALPSTIAARTFKFLLARALQRPPQDAVRALYQAPGTSFAPLVLSFDYILLCLVARRLLCPLSFLLYNDTSRLAVPLYSPIVALPSTRTLCPRVYDVSVPSILEMLNVVFLLELVAKDHATQLYTQDGFFTWSIGSYTVSIPAQVMFIQSQLDYLNKGPWLRIFTHAHRALGALEMAACKLVYGLQTQEPAAGDVLAQLYSRFASVIAQIHCVPETDFVLPHISSSPVTPVAGAAHTLLTTLTSPMTLAKHINIPSIDDTHVDLLGHIRVLSSKRMRALMEKSMLAVAAVGKLSFEYTMAQVNNSWTLLTSMTGRVVWVTCSSTELQQAADSCLSLRAPGTSFLSDATHLQQLLHTYRAVAPATEKPELHPLTAAVAWLLAAGVLPVLLQDISHIQSLLDSFPSDVYLQLGLREKIRLPFPSSVIQYTLTQKSSKTNTTPHQQFKQLLQAENTVFQKIDPVHPIKYIPALYSLPPDSTSRQALKNLPTSIVNTLPIPEAEKQFLTSIAKSVLFDIRIYDQGIIPDWISSFSTKYT